MAKQLITQQNLWGVTATSATSRLRGILCTCLADPVDTDEVAGQRVMTLLFDGAASSLCVGLAKTPSARITYGSTSRLCDQLHTHQTTVRACLNALKSAYAPDLVSAVGAELDSDLDHERAVAAAVLLVLCLAGGV